MTALPSTPHELHDLELAERHIHALTADLNRTRIERERLRRECEYLRERLAALGYAEHEDDYALMARSVGRP